MIRIWYVTKERKQKYKQNKKKMDTLWCKLHSEWNHKFVSHNFDSFVAVTLVELALNHPNKLNGFLKNELNEEVVVVVVGGGEDEFETVACCMVFKAVVVVAIVFYRKEKKQKNKEKKNTNKT